MFIWIYKLIKKDATNDDMIYIGSTGNTDERWNKHKSACNNLNDKHYHYKVYKYIRDNGNINEWQMIILDEIEVPLIKCEERSKYEDEYILKYDAINKLNEKKAFRTKEEIIEYYKKKGKLYRLNNVEKCSEKDKKNGKIRYARDKERMIQQAKLNYEKNKDKINERTKQKISCDICGSIITKGNITAHQRTQKCINFKNLAIY